MKNKKDNSDPIDNLEYEKVLEEEIINSYESKFDKASESDRKKVKFYRLKRTPLEIVNRLFFFFFIGSFIFSLSLAYSESKLWFILYVLSALSCVFYTPNRKALKELIAAWPNIEDLIKGRSLWRKGK
ncbi:DUP family protein [Prochlorococcus sp. AH-716-J21]|nr:DUP family protein [Prochlorococcus sp. AH-716-J21]